MKPVKTPHQKSEIENEPKKEKIKFHNEAHRKNYEGVMKDLSERKLPLDSETMIEQMRRNSKD